MTEIEQKALEMISAARKEHPTPDNYLIARTALCRAIEQHEATKQEVERLNALITATADHWMTLQFKHPIQWEGAIDSAMAAACAEIEKHEAFRQEVSFALKTFKDGNMHTMHDYLLEPFIIPAPKPDPLVDVLLEMDLSSDPEEGQHDAKWLRIKLDALGFEIREKNDDQ